jgi:hypothetical protein
LASSINASTTAGLVNTADTSGVLQLQTAGVTAISIDASQAVSFTNSPTVTGGTANGVAYLNGSKVLTTGSALTFDGTNLGLGVTPSAWDSIVKVLELNNGVHYGAQTDSTPVLYSGANAYYQTNWKFKTTGYATRYQQDTGKHQWFVSTASGTAGNAITFTQAMTLDADGDLGIGTTSPSYRLEVRDTADATIALVKSGANSLRFLSTSSGGVINQVDANPLAFYTSNTERARIDSSGFFGVGTTSPASYGVITGYRASGTASYIVGVNGGGCQTAIGVAGDNESFLGTLSNNALRLATNGTERARIDTSGNAFFSGNYTVAYPGSGNTTTGIFLESAGQFCASRDNTVVGRFNRNTSDGTLISFARQGTEQGTISVSGGTVSYNAFAGSHWSQLSDGSKPDILRGTVLDSINELVQWPDEPTTERLCKVKVSDTAGSKKVYGVFMDWDNDWTATNDMYVTAVGAFICRVNASVTVQEGDLLESNGDGTARVQADDIIRSSTIGKVTCTEKTHQYDDGSYCVPTVLYCG